MRTWTEGKGMMKVMNKLEEINWWRLRANQRKGNGEDYEQNEGKELVKLRTNRRKGNFEDCEYNEGKERRRLRAQNKGKK